MFRRRATGGPLVRGSLSRAQRARFGGDGTGFDWAEEWVHGTQRSERRLDDADGEEAPARTARRADAEMSQQEPK